MKFGLKQCVVAGLAFAGLSSTLPLLSHAQSTSPAKPDADMQRVLNALKSLHPKPIETLTPAQARMQPSASDAVKAVLKSEGKPTNPLPEIMTKNVTIPGAAKPLAARIYTPPGQGPFPVIVYFHGGGFVIANIDTYDASARALAKNTNAIVVSADYRHAPEYKFPAQQEDAFAAYQWVLAHASEFNGNPAKVAVAGESAGGNLAVNVSTMARDQGIQLPVAEALIYPVAGKNMNTASYVENAQAKPLNKPMMAWFFKNTVNSPADASNPKLDLLHANLKGLPPTIIVSDQIDPLRTEDQQLARRFKEDGVDVTDRNYNGVTHEFFGMGAVVSKAKSAEIFVSDQLKQAFNK